MRWWVVTVIVVAAFGAGFVSGRWSVPTSSSDDPIIDFDGEFSVDPFEVMAEDSLPIADGSSPRGANRDETSHRTTPSTDQRSSSTRSSTSSSVLPSASWLTCRFSDADDEEIGQTPGIVIEPVEEGDPMLVAVPTRALLGAVKGLASRDGRVEGRIERVLSVGRTNGLSLCTWTGNRAGLPVVTTRPESGTAGRLFQGRSRRHGLPITFDRVDYLPASGIEVGHWDHAGAVIEGGVVVDETGSVVAVFAPRDLRPTKDTVSFLLDRDHLRRFDRVDLDLATFTQTYFAGSAEDWLRQARKALAERRFLDAIDAFRGAVQRDDALWDKIRSEFLSAYRGALADSVGRGNEDRYLELLAAATRDFPDDIDLAVAFAETNLKTRRFAEALVAFEEAWRIDAARIGDLVSRKAEIYRIWAKWWLDQGNVDGAARVLEEGLAVVGDHGELLALYGRVLMQLRDFAGAARAWRDAIAVDGNLAVELNPLIVRADRLTEGPGKVVIDYPPNARSIIARVMINGQATGEFIVDTGATSTWLPSDLADRAGVRVGGNPQRVRVNTAGGERILPYVPLQSASIGDLSVPNLRVIVGDLPGLSGRGLLGMDYLGKFVLENDTVNGRLVLMER